MQAIQQVQYLTIKEEDIPQRLDNFLTKRLKGVPRSLIYRIIRSGEVRINKSRSQPSYKLQTNDTVRIPPLRISESDTVHIANNKLQQLQDSIIFHDKGLIVINKPVNIAVHGGSGINYGIIEAMRKLYPKYLELELVHRLDRDTSGLLMLTYKRSLLRYLHQQLRDGLINKHYTALVRGVWPNSKKQINASLLKNVLKSGERKVKVDTSGKPALTKFKVIKSFGNFASLIEASPITGRTHQIRVHAQYAGHPIAGDEKYGDDDFNQHIAKSGSKRLFLHAHALKLTLSDGTKIALQAEPESIWQQILYKLEQNKLHT